MRPIDAYALAEKISAYTGAMTALSSMPTLSLNTLRDEIYQDALKHGLWYENNMWPVTCAMLVSDEADELMDAGVDWEDNGFDPDDPEEAYSEELADVIIMSLSVAGALGIDIDAAIRRKMAINKRRPWGHGKEDK